MVEPTMSSSLDLGAPQAKTPPKAISPVGALDENQSDPSTPNGEDLPIHFHYVNANFCRIRELGLTEAIDASRSPSE
jgi:hypothetical protein